MSSFEQEPSAEPITTSQAVWELKSAQTYLLVSPMEWSSADDEFNYTAVPLEIPGREPIDLATLPDMPLWRFSEVLNMWEIAQIARPDINGDVELERFLVAGGLPLLHTTHIVPRELIENSEEKKINDVILQSSILQGELGLTDAEPKNYETITKAIACLKVVATAAMKEHFERLSNMTDEERRWERMQKYGWLVTPEMDRNGEPRWWGISEGSLLWAVFSATPDEAVIMIEDKRDGAPMLPFFFVDEYPEEIQAELKQKLSDKKVVRLIPYSTEAWPEDPNDMSDAQKAAIEQLK